MMSALHPYSTQKYAWIDGFAIRRHILKNFTGKKHDWGSLGAGFAGVLSATVFNCNI
jgi:hypothetical protein